MSECWTVLSARPFVTAGGNKKIMRGGNLESRQGTAKSFSLLVYWAYVVLWHPGLWGKCVIMKEFCFMHPSVRACLLVETVHPSEYRLNCVTWHCCSLLPYPYGLCHTAPWVLKRTAHITSLISRPTSSWGVSRTSPFWHPSITHGLSVGLVMMYPCSIAFDYTPLYHCLWLARPGITAFNNTTMSHCLWLYTHVSLPLTIHPRITACEYMPMYHCLLLYTHV